MINLSKSELSHLANEYNSTEEDIISGITYLIDNWERATREIENGYNDIYGEYINDISIRSSLEEFISSGPDSLREKIKSKINESDKRFITSTHSVETNIVRENLGPGVLGIWERIPNKPGPDLEKELRQMGFF